MAGLCCHELNLRQKLQICIKIKIIREKEQYSVSSRTKCLETMPTGHAKTWKRSEEQEWYSDYSTIKYAKEIAQVVTHTRGVNCKSTIQDEFNYIIA